MAATLDAVFDEIRRIQTAGADEIQYRPAALADDRAGNAQGLDRPEGGRRPAGGRDFRHTRSRFRILSKNPQHLAQLDQWLQQLSSG